MIEKIELLAPAGDLDSAKAAIIAGADAIYIGLNKFNARNRATNIDFDDLYGIIRLAHENSCKVFVTLNILVLDNELPALFKVLNKLVNTQVDGVIVQDLGLFYFLSSHFKSLDIHASTQLTTHNIGQIKFLKKLQASRVNLSRELNLEEIRVLSACGKKEEVLTEVFVHGSYCISFSGVCYMSSVLNGKSGNRGQCSQQCREEYLETPAGKKFPLNMKDNSAFHDLDDLVEAGVASLKIEGRIKEFEYVYTVVNSWREQISRFYTNQKLIDGDEALKQVFNRDFSNGYLKGNIGENMFIDNPMSQTSQGKNAQEKNDLYAEKASIRLEIQEKIDELNTDKISIRITVTGEKGSALKISVALPESQFELNSIVNLTDIGTEVLTQKIVMQRLKSLTDTEFKVEDVDFSGFEENLFFPFRELNRMKKELLYRLNGSKEYISPVNLPVLTRPAVKTDNPRLSVLISSQTDLNLCEDLDADLYFQLPASLRHKCSELIEMFLSNGDLIPWFPSILIGDDYLAVLDFLQKVKPKLIVSNNSGIGYEAYIQDIPWIAGPYMNITNSFSLKALQENFSCKGAFISNELNDFQIRQIKAPANFDLHYSIYHPINLMTSRQCFFLTSSGCHKNKVDETCLPDCQKSTSITDLNGHTFLIKKTKGNYNEIFHETNFLNTDIVSDIPDRISNFMIDLRVVPTKTVLSTDSKKIAHVFSDYLGKVQGAREELDQLIQFTTCEQYQKGI